ncbi:MAG: TRAM domain-containing protein [Kiritimatiellia bacterium]|jgi:predicted RNA-binding protein with TRAM domain|nr:TRAM domain-containing protein [Kiritimatiellia bacterium]
MTDTPPPPAPNSKWKAVAIVFLVLLGIASAILVARHVKPTEKKAVTIVYTEDQPGAADINVGDIIDATDPATPLEPKLGYRYKLFVEDESDDRTSGVAKIGGRITFISGARRGQTILADVTRVRERVVDANLVRVLSEIDMPTRPPRPAFAPRDGDSAAHVVAGAEMDVIIAEESTKNPGLEGIAKVEGLVVVVDGIPTVGERVNVRITDRRERIAFAEPTGKPAGTGPLPSATPPKRGFQPDPDDSAAHVVTGAEMDVIIAEESTKNPGLEGIARVEGLVVAVDGVPTVGERVNVRIVSRLANIAFAEPTGKPAGTDPLPSSVKPVQRVFKPRAGDPAAHVVPGAEMDVVIAEASGKNPGIDGVARVKGLVVFVEGVPTIGETVHVRITHRTKRAANAVLSGKPAGSGTTQPTGDMIRRAFTPDTAHAALAHVIAGAEMEVTILERSTKFPDTEGVAKIDGLVVFVTGATNVGDTVRIRITARRERVAFADVIAAP